MTLDGERAGEGRREGTLRAGNGAVALPGPPRVLPVEGGEENFIILSYHLPFQSVIMLMRRSNVMD